MLHELRPKIRAESSITHSEAGGLSTVMKLAASDDPKKNAFQLLGAGLHGRRVEGIGPSRRAQAPHVEHGGGGQKGEQGGPHPGGSSGRPRHRRRTRARPDRSRGLDETVRAAAGAAIRAAAPGAAARREGRAALGRHRELLGVGWRVGRSGWPTVGVGGTPRTGRGTKRTTVASAPAATSTATSRPRPAPGAKPCSATSAPLVRARPSGEDGDALQLMAYDAAARPAHAEGHPPVDRRVGHRRDQQGERIGSQRRARPWRSSTYSTT